MSTANQESLVLSHAHEKIVGAGFDLVLEHPLDKALGHTLDSLRLDFLQAF